MTDHLTDPAQTNVTEFIQFRLGDFAAALQNGPLGHGHDAESFPPAVTAFDEIADGCDINGDFRDKNHIRAARKARLKGDPTRMPAHNFHDHHPIV